MTRPAKINLSLLPVLDAAPVYIPAAAAVGKASTKDNANIWRKGKDAGCRCGYDQVHLFLPRACCHYSFLSHANVQISLVLVQARRDIEVPVPVLKRQWLWQRDGDSPMAGPAPRAQLPRAPLRPLCCFFSCFLGSWWAMRRAVVALGWRGGGAGGTQSGALLERTCTGCAGARPHGLAWPLLPGQPMQCRKGFWDPLERKNLPSHLFLIISVFHNYPG